MGIILVSRDLGSDIQSVKTTFSSWDQCMSEAYCKWPVVIGIVIGGLIILSLSSCLVRCLCCGAECCCGCLACCNACCPSPRRRHQGYQQQPPTPYQQYPMYNQYQVPQQPPVYGSGGLGPRNAPQTATFAVSGRNKSGAAAIAANADSLPAMPTWETAQSRRVEDEDEDDMEDIEMEKLVARPPATSPAPLPQSQPQYWQQQQQQQQRPEQRPLYSQPYSSQAPSYTSTPVSPYVENEHAEFSSNPNPYTDYQQHYPPSEQQQQTHQADSPSVYQYPPSYHTNFPPQPAPSSAFSHSQPSSFYEPSIAPSYHTTAPQAQASRRPPSGLQIGRRPVQGSWREV